MNTEFTGERVIPGQVEVDLWNEHFARYLFARRFAAGKRVLDAGCGAGYGSAELATVAKSVTAIDIAAEAVTAATEQHPGPRYTQASAASLPFADASFDLVTMFEVIEHVADWPAVLREARRVLAPEGHLIVSTPNKSFYAETREAPNPYHEHEFEYAEFRDALAEVFPQVTMFLEDHAESILFRPVAPADSHELQVQPGGATPDASSFFIAVCGTTAVPAQSFVYLPSAANMLREKLDHIRALEQEIRTKDAWIAQEQAAHRDLLQKHAEQLAELQKSNQWALQLQSDLDRARKRSTALHFELEQLRSTANEAVAGYENKIEELNFTIAERTKWAQEMQRDFTESFAKCQTDLDHHIAELAKCVKILHETETALEDRTQWALRLTEEKARLEALLGAARASRWIRVGRVVGLGPELQER